MSKIHTAYYGVTLSGKTTLARAIARDLSGKSTLIIYDPVLSDTLGGGWPTENAIIVSEPDELLAILCDDKCPPAEVFIDESADIFGHAHPENDWLATRGRHFGLYLHIIAQRPKMIRPNVRNQMARTYCFRLARDDMKEVGADNGFSDLVREELDTGDFLILNSGSATYTRANIFNLLKGHAK